MTIEEKAKKWAKNHPQYQKLSTENKKKSVKEVKDCIQFALTSLLEELPEVDKTEFSAIIYQTAYREKIKSLIQNKLK